ncbi:hypothetical protein SNE40_000109 [Patella caerulea]|uniref:Uncharacterized protein n=1 Tax=Patella caerulea TaxID=87958 RepID=A0AAN8KGB0_PATCE
MSILLVFLWANLPFYTESIIFPGQGKPFIIIIIPSYSVSNSCIHVCFIFLLRVGVTSQIIQNGNISDEGPLIAVLDFRARRMDIFDPSDGGNATVIEAINLMGRRGGGSTGIDFNYRGNIIYWTDAITRGRL